MRTCRIDGEALSALIAEAEAKHPLETGGVLMGYWYEGEPVVISIIGPGWESRHDSHGFEPDSAWQRERIAEVYELSGRRHTYLGDWHTHPDGLPRPSRLDRKTLTGIAAFPEARAATPLMLIGGGQDTWEFTAWCWRGWRLGDLVLARPPRAMAVRAFG